jgi:hypothetical protein
MYSDNEVMLRQIARGILRPMAEAAAIRTCPMANCAATRTRRQLLLAVAGAMALATAADARMATPPTIAAMTSSAAHVFRGQCMSAVEGTADVAGARVAVTTYTFRASEHLKGRGKNTVVFRQVGTPAGGPRDLGHLVGLPVYAPGTEYVLFLLPESPARITSPAGAGDGAFIVTGDTVRGVHADAAGSPPRDATGIGDGPSAFDTMSYDALRRDVLTELGR